MTLFESLKKKFSETSGKLRNKVETEAKEENNLELIEEEIEEKAIDSSEDIESMEDSVDDHEEDESVEMDSADDGESVEMDSAEADESGFEDSEEGLDDISEEDLDAALDEFEEAEEDPEKENSGFFSRFRRNKKKDIKSDEEIKEKSEDLDETEESEDLDETEESEDLKTEESDEIGEESEDLKTEESDETKDESVDLETGESDDTKEESSEEKKDGESAVASGDETVEEEEVVEDWMVPIPAENVADGEYDIKVDSSSSMFNITACKLTVADGKMTAIMTMGGKGYRYLYMGTGEEAVAADESEYIPYVEDADGAHTFTVPVDALDEGIACAAFSNKKEKWYERTLVFRSDSLPADAIDNPSMKTAEDLGIADGEYTVEVTLSGGSGRATVESPTKIKVENGIATATIIMSSSNYDYVIVGEEKYLPVNTEGNSTFEIPVTGFDYNMPISADTTAMSTPHEIDYTLYFDSKTIK